MNRIQQLLTPAVTVTLADCAPMGVAGAPGDRTGNGVNNAWRVAKP